MPPTLARADRRKRARAKRPVSIRKRILFFGGALLLAAAFALVVYIRDYAERASDRAFDRLLAASALTIGGAVQLEAGRVTVELPLASFAMFSGEDRIFYAVESPQGQNVTGEADLSEGLAPATGSDPVFADKAFRDDRVRVASVGRLVSTAEGTGWVTIRVAETRGERDALAREILHNALWPILLLTLLALLLLWAGIGRAFAPLLSLETHLRERSPDDLSPVELPTPSETAQLVGALNGFTARLKLARERLEALVAEAAHEVRTPLASLRAQAELALAERDPAALRRDVERIHEGAVQASQLVSQLLMDATVTHRLENQPEPTPVAPLAQEVVRRLSPDLSDRVSLSIAPDAAEAELDVDRVVLREAIRNLVDNALRYSEGEVEISIARDGPALDIAVRDRGPGIPDHEKPLVFGRFRRGEAGSRIDRGGSGLGLAIVARVAEAHRGAVLLRDREGGGLAVHLRLPAEATSASQPPAPDRRHVLALLALFTVIAGAFLAPRPAEAAADFPAREKPAAATLHILGATDTGLFSHLIRAFQAAHPIIAVAYEENESRAVYDQLVSGQKTAPDLVVSSASDLQVKLVNEGLVRPFAPMRLAAIPDWARWRSEVFGFTFEPAVIVYNTNLVKPEEAPRTHLELAELLEREPQRFLGRVGTYDVARSGVGYLLATQDQAISSYFWRLAAAFGRARVQLTASSPEILDRIATGDLAMGYNIIGSYAFARADAGAPIGIVVPDDYVLVFSRSLLIPEDAPQPELAEAFIEFALSPAGQAILAGPAALGALLPGADGRWTADRIASLGQGAVQPIRFGPSLLVGLDRQRRERFLATWQEIVSPH
ncbi:sensor histidine kinase [Aureimonas sp. N4]|uniref:sensor histidine kinase n=1 Tax=Aureimonas sp. N4 TaxID=1638165 RepID=UPI0007837548|nr:extracellular solute-binding protein [Aureimonas sp. N4]